MNILKKIMIALSATLIVGGCSKDDEVTNGNDATISLSTNIIQVDKNGGDATVTVTSSGDWRLSGVCDWAYPSATSGKDGDVITFTVAPNKLDEKRTATFKFFTGSTVVPLQIEAAPAYIMDLLSNENITISKTANSVQVQLNTNVADPTIGFSEGGEEWLTFDKRNDFGGKTTLLFKAAENTSYKGRTSTITISSPLVATPISVNINQKQTDAIIPEKQSLMYDLAARNISFKVKYNVEYAISIAQGNEWITNQSVSQPQTGSDGLSTVTVTYDLSSASATRGGIIRITNAGNTITSDIAIVQKDPDVKLIEIPDENLRALVVKNKWVLEIAGSQCVVLEAGLNATSLSNSSYSSKLTNLAGIENFPNLTSLSLGYCTNMKKLDISGLHKVKTLSFNSTNNCAEYNLGDNPITSFTAGGTYMYSYAESLKIIGSKIETLNLTISSWYTDSDNVTSIDVSECPALTTLNANRSNKVKTLYLKTGQNIPNLIKNEATSIVYK